MTSSGRCDFEGFDGGVVIAEGKDLVAFPAEDFGDHLHHGHFIVNQQDFCHAGTLCKAGARPQAASQGFSSSYECQAHLPDGGLSLFLNACRKPGRSA